MENLEILSECNIPLKRDNFDLGIVKMMLLKYRKLEYIILIKGDVKNKQKVLTRVHSECITGDLFGSLKCDCGEQLTYSYKLISQSENGVIIYIKGQEGRGIGLNEKLKAYFLQDNNNLDTIQANEILGFNSDYRTYDNIDYILCELLKIESIKLITNNSDKIKNIKIEKEIINTKPTINIYNKKYINTKIQKMNHKIIL